jgi:hypothetical protein
MPKFLLLMCPESWCRVSPKFVPRIAESCGKFMGRKMQTDGAIETGRIAAKADLASVWWRWSVLRARSGLENHVSEHYTTTRQVVNEHPLLATCCVRRECALGERCPSKAK